MTGRLFSEDATLNPAVALRESRFVLGLDLGQARDYSALAIIERAEITTGERDPVTWEYRTERRQWLRHLRRVPLDTPYPDLVGMVRDVIAGGELAGRSTLVVDATGVGAPVVDLLRRERLGCTLAPVVITSGNAESGNSAAGFHVPKRDLILGLQVAFQKGWLEIARSAGCVEELIAELTSVEGRVSASGYERYGARGHDDLVMATALAWWRVRWNGG